MERTEHNWGFELILWKDKNFTVKLIHIDHGCETKPHKHLYKREIIINENLNAFNIEATEPHILGCEKDKNFIEFIEVSKNDSIFDNIDLE